MCGINGLLDFKNRYTSEERHNLVCRMNEEIIHRGPDAEGIYDGEWCCMGMRRLSIIDLSTGDQPVYNEDHTLAAVFNGEIYNYKKLRQELIHRGHCFATASDTEVIVHLYEEYGGQCFAMLDGMFALAVYDRKKEILILARDRMGEKPLYFYRNNSLFLFASELKSMPATDLIPKEISSEALSFYFRYTYIPAPLTIFKDVKKLLPGHYLTIGKDGRMSEETYWELTVDEDCAGFSYEEAVSELRRRLNRSVKERMNCDVPYGAFLSGGLDSGIIAALMARNSERPIKTFTIGFEEADYDESRNAALMAAHIGSEHHACIMHHRDAMEIMDRVISSMDEPFADSSALPEYLVSEYASREVKVVLTGDAGDECFLGYEKYLIDYYSRIYLKLPNGTRKLLIEPVMELLPDTTAFSRKVNKLVSSAYTDIFSKRKNTMQLGFKEEDCRKLFQEGWNENSGENRIREYYNRMNGTDLRKTQYTDLHLVLEGDMLAKVDRMAMLNSLETRTPMLANDIVQFAFSLPDTYKLKGRNKKRILKDAFLPLLPKGYTKLPKSGFGIPLDHWFRNEMKKEMLDVLDVGRIQGQGILSGEYVEKIIREHLTGKRNRKSEIWALFVFEKWYEKVMESK
nr:asparagine synthase (glutamine-hydrolyzing) [uncultured Blautia sp.]